MMTVAEKVRSEPFDPRKSFRCGWVFLRIRHFDLRVWISMMTGFRATMCEEFESDDDLLPADSIVKKCSVSLGGFEEVIQCALFELVSWFNEAKRSNLRQNGCIKVLKFEQK